MRPLLIGALAGMMLLSISPAQAADLDQSVVDQVTAATPGATTPEALQSAIEAMLNNATSDAQKEAILTAAMSLNPSDSALSAIGAAASNTGVSPLIVASAATSTGSDLATVLASTAAGNGNNGNGQGPGNGNGQGQGQGLNTAPGQTGVFSNNGGSGGGGGASPSA